jgi:predicted DNA-binding antitoxin AbrB/MazE fold protein
MAQKFKAIYQEGKFILQEPCDLPEGTEVELTIGSPSLSPPAITDPEERKRVMKELVERMQANPIPAEAPRRFTREELHERR